MQTNEMANIYYKYLKSKIDKLAKHKNVNLNNVIYFNSKLIDSINNNKNVQKGGTIDMQQIDELMKIMDKNVISFFAEIAKLQKKFSGLQEQIEKLNLSGDTVSQLEEQIASINASIVALNGQTPPP
jgi:hypothetical protein